MKLPKIIKDTIKNCWYKACLSSVRDKHPTSIGLITYFYDYSKNELNIISQKGEISYELQCSLNLFLQGVKNCIEARRVTAYIADQCLKEIIHSSILILQWMAENGFPTHVKAILRRKSIDSDLSKILDKALSNEDPEVKDRFGFTLITYDNDNLDNLYKITETVIGILTGIFEDKRKSFLQWLISNPNLSEKDSTQTLRIMNCPLRLRNRGEMHGNTDDFDAKKFPNVIIPSKKIKFFFEYGFKDYVKSPKENSYQSLQCVLDFYASLVNIINELAKSSDSNLLGDLTNKRMFEDILDSAFKNLFPDIPENDCKKIIATMTSTITRIPIEAHFKTKAMADNPNATHEAHKSRVSEFRELFNLSKKQIQEIKSIAEAHGNVFTFYDGQLYDPWGLHHAVFFSPEEKIFYYNIPNGTKDDILETQESN